MRSSSVVSQIGRRRARIAISSRAARAAKSGEEACHDAPRGQSVQQQRRTTLGSGRADLRRKNPQWPEYPRRRRAPAQPWNLPRMSAARLLPARGVGAEPIARRVGQRVATTVDAVFISAALVRGASFDAGGRPRADGLFGPSSRLACAGGVRRGHRRQIVAFQHLLAARAAAPTATAFWGALAEAQFARGSLRDLVALLDEDTSNCACWRDRCDNANGCPGAFRPLGPERQSVEPRRSHRATVVASEMPARMPTRMADTNFAVRSWHAHLR